MNFKLTDEQLMIQETARSFAKNELAPMAQQIDKTKQFSLLVGNIQKLAALGFMGLAVPESYGGVNAGTVAHSIALTEIGAFPPILTLPTVISCFFFLFILP